MGSVGNVHLRARNLAQPALVVVEGRFGLRVLVVRGGGFLGRAAGVVFDYLLLVPGWEGSAAGRERGMGSKPISFETSIRAGIGILEARASKL